MHSFDRRLRSYAIDIAMAFVVAVLIALGTPLKANIKAILSCSAYFLVMIGPYFFNTGQTFGKRIQKMRVISVKTNKKANMLIIILRELFKHFLSIITFGLYIIVCAFIVSSRRDGRAPHDFIFGTQVICLTRYTSDKNEYINIQSERARDSLKGMGPND